MRTPSFMVLFLIGILLSPYVPLQAASSAHNVVLLQHQDALPPTATGSISGFILRADDFTPVENAQVEIFTLSSVLVTTVVSDNNGFYSAPNITPGQFYVRASKVGYARLYYPNQVERLNASLVDVFDGGITENINFLLDVGGSVAGVVTEADGSTPISGALIEVLTPNSDLLGTTLSATDGTYTVNDIPAWQVIVRARKLGFAVEYYDNQTSRNNATWINVSQSTTTPDINFTLDEGGTITGTVTEADGITPIPFATVFAYLPSSGVSYFTDTGWDGTYVLGVPVDTYTVGVDASGRVTEYYDNHTESFLADPVTVTTTSPTDNINFALDLGGTITGKVTEADGTTPIPNATIWINSTGYNTDDNGDYTYPNLAAGTYTVYAEANGYVTEYYNNQTTFDAADPVTVTGGVVTPDINFTLDPAGAITGKVTQEDGITPITNATIWINNAGYGTNANGEYTYPNLPPGTYTVYAEAPGYVREYYNNKTTSDTANPVTVVASATTTNINFTLGTGGRISGTVTSFPSGVPIASAQIAIQTLGGQTIAYASSAADGTYTATGLPSGTYVVNASRNGYPTEYYNNQTTLAAANPVTVTTNVTTPNINFTLEEGGVIAGKVTQADGTTPISGADIMVTTPTGSYAGGTQSAADGTYRATGLTTGNYVVRVNAATFAPEYYNNQTRLSTANTVAVTFNVTTPNINFTLDPAARIAGKVFATDGVTPLADASLYATSTDDDFPLATAISAADGSYTLDVATGSYRMQATLNGYLNEYYDNQSDFSSATLVSATNNMTTANINFTLDTGATIAGTITQAGGVTPAANVEVRLYPVGQPAYIYVTTTTDNTGAYTFSTLKAGTYSLRASSPALGIVFYTGKLTLATADTVTVADGATLSGINFSFLPTGTISGNITASAAGSGAPDTGIIGSPIAGEVAFNAEAAFQERFNRSYDSYLASAQANGQSALGDIWTMILPTPLHRTLADFGGTPPLVWSVSTALPEDGIAPNVVADGVVEARNLDEDGITHTATIQANGNYMLTGVPPGRYSVRAAASGHVTEYFNDYYASYIAPYVVVNSSITTFNINMRLAPAGVVNGRITAASGGAPLANMEVYWIANNYESLIRCTNANGDYTLPDAPSNNSFRVFASGRACNSGTQTYVSEYWQEAQAYNQSTPLLFPLTGGTMNNINFTLSTGGTISGTVYRNDGATPEGATVEIYDTARNLVYSGYNNGIGLYTSALLVPGNYYVRAYNQYNIDFPDKYYPNADSIATATLVTVTAGVDTPNINITLPTSADTSGSISGRIFAPDGATPVWVNTDVVLSSPQTPNYLFRGTVLPSIEIHFANPDSEGRYTFSGLQAGNYLLEVRTPNYVNEFYPNQPTRTTAIPIVVTAGQAVTNIDVVLNPGTLVSGRVIDITTGLPIKNSVIRIYDSTGKQFAYGVDYDDGTFAATLAAGDYTVFARDGYLGIGGGRWYSTTNSVIDRASATPITVTGSGTLPNINISLGRGGEIMGRVTQSDGVTPIANAAVRISQAGSPYITTFCANAQGIYVNPEAMIAGNNIVMAFNGTNPCLGSAGNFAPEYWQNAATKADADAVTPTFTDRVAENINFTLSAGAGISGTVYQTNGTTPIANATVNAYALEEGEYNAVASVQTDANGHYQIVGLSSQAYYVEAGAPSYLAEVYPNQTDLTAGTPVMATVGSVVPDINFTLAAGNTGTFTGAVNLQGRPPKPHVSWVIVLNVTITSPAGGMPASEDAASTQATVFSGTVATDPNGRFTISEIPPGTYTVVTEIANALPITTSNVIIAAGNNPMIDLGTLRAGDVDGNNLVNVTDFSILATSFSKSTGQVGFDARADFNNDGLVNVTDFSVLASNFGQSG